MVELEASSGDTTEDQRAPSPPPDSSDRRDDPEPSRPPPPPAMALPKEKRVASEKQREALRRAREAKKANAEIHKKSQKAYCPGDAHQRRTRYVRFRRACTTAGSRRQAEAWGYKSAVLLNDPAVVSRQPVCRPCVSRRYVPALARQPDPRAARYIFECEGT